MTDEHPDSLIERFTAQYRALAGHAHVVADAAAAAVTALEILRDADVEQVALAALPAAVQGPLRDALDAAGVAFVAEPFPAHDLPGLIDGVQAGITGATFAIAQSGTLVEASTDDAVRLTSSLPRIHIGLVFARDIVPSFEDAAPRLRDLFAAEAGGCAITFISGPSRTGDIELKLTLGVHGPETAHAIVIRS